MFELNNLAKYSTTQIEGELKQVKRLIAKYWLYVVIFVTFASVLTAMAIITTNLYVFKFLDDVDKYLAISSGVVAVIFWVLFFIYFVLNRVESKKAKILDTYLKNNIKKKK